MAKKKGTAATILLVILALFLLVLALSGNASTLLKGLVDWLTGSKAGPPEKKQKDGGTGSGVTEPATAPAPAGSPAPVLQGPPVPTAPVGPPLPYPYAPKSPDPKSPTTPKVQVPGVWDDPWPEIAGILATVGAGLLSLVPGPGAATSGA